MRKTQNPRNILYLVLSIVIAAGIWYYVDEFNGRVVTQTVTGIPIEYINQDALADNGLMLAEGEDSGTSTTIDIIFKGNRRHIVQLDRSKIRVTANLASITEAGVQSVKPDLTYTDRKFNSGNTSVEEQSLYMATVNICELSHKEVELRCELTGNVAEGYSAGKDQLSQTAIEVRGQEDDIAVISYAKVVFDVGKNAKETVTASLDYKFYDTEGHEVDASGVHAEAGQIQATLPVYVTKELKLEVDFQEAPGARLADMAGAIRPESIMVSGDASVLNGIDSIVLDSFDLSNVTKESTTHSYAILVPDGCENLSGVTKATLEIGYPDKAIADVTTQNIQVVDPPSDRTVEILTTQLTVRIVGTETEVADVTGEDVTIVADLSDYAVASGTYMVPAQVEVDGRVGVSGTYQVQIRIPEAQE